MRRNTKLWLVATTLVAAAGCDPEAPGLEGVSAPTGFAVTHSDYTSAAAIALLGPDGDLVEERFVHSGTVFEGLGSALSSDVVLPTAPGAAGTLTYIERLGVNAVTTIDIEAGDVVSQIQTQVSDGSGYQSNPYDYLQIDADTAWVTRNAPNTTAADNDIDAGNDLFALNLADAEAGNERIGFAAMNTTANVINPDTGESTEVVVYARPASLVGVGQHAVVGLDRISLAYDAIGPGMVALADLTAKTAEPLELEGLSNCGSVIPVEGDATRVIVACQGSFLADPRETAGLALVHVSGGIATIEHVWAAAAYEADPVAVSNVVSIGGTRVIAIAPGDFGSNPDRALVVDIATGETELIVEAAGSYVLGAGAYNPASRTLLLPDASTDDNGVVNAGLRRFQWNAAGEINELDLVETDPDLPPLTVAALR